MSFYLEKVYEEIKFLLTDNDISKRCFEIFRGTKFKSRCGSKKVMIYLCAYMVTENEYFISLAEKFPRFKSVASRCLYLIDNYLLEEKNINI